MCSCGKKKQVIPVITQSVSLDLTEQVKVEVAQESYYISDMMNVPVILSANKPNLVFKKDLKVLKSKGIDFKVIA